MPQTQGTMERFGNGRAGMKAQPQRGDSRPTEAFTEALRPDGRANLRNVWSIPTSPFSAAHFATFPPALVEPCIKAGTSERGVCGDCGAPWGREVDTRLVTREGERPCVTSRHEAADSHDAGSSRASTHVRGMKPHHHHRLAPHLRPPRRRDSGHLPRPLRRRRHRRTRGRPIAARCHPHRNKPRVRRDGEAAN